MITARSGYFRTFRDLQLHIIGAAESDSYFSYKANDYMEEHTVIWKRVSFKAVFLLCGWGPMWIKGLNEVGPTNHVGVFQVTVHLSMIAVRLFRENTCV